VNVHSEALASKILEDATDLGLKAIVGINLGDPEDITDYEEELAGTSARKEADAETACIPQTVMAV
jgi:hypothetical protein